MKRSSNSKSYYYKSFQTFSKKTFKKRIKLTQISKYFERIQYFAKDDKSIDLTTE
jgi:hypothetical protein